MVDASQGLAVRSHVARDLLQNAALFKTDKLAVWEYVVNGLEYVDPGVSPRVTVSLDSRKKRVAIADNGRGMDWQGLKNFFVMHGENIDRKQGRPGRGRFGTGKAAAFGIGGILEITTVRNGKRSRVRLQRSQLERMSSGDDVPVEIMEREVPTDAPNGTVVEIDAIHIRAIDQPGIVKYIERHLAHWPKNAAVIVNNRECEWHEPPLAEARTFRPEGSLAEILGDVSLTIKVSKSPLEEELRGVSIYANGVWHATTLAGSEGREMSQFILGDIDVPMLDEDDSPIPPFDLSRSMRLNAENDLVQAVLAFVGQKVDLVRRELLERDKKDRATEEAKKLAEQADEIAKLLNEDFSEFSHKLAKVRALSKGGLDLHDEPEGGETDQDLILGSMLPAEIVGRTGGPGHGDGQMCDGDSLPNLGAQVRSSDEAQKRGKPGGGPGGQQRPRGGFGVKFDGMGYESPRAQYVRDQRTIFINLDHPQLVAARGLGSTEEAVFRRLSYEVAFSEYAIALASELAARDEYLDPSDPIVDIRDTLNRLARKGASLYALVR